MRASPVLSAASGYSGVTTGYAGSAPEHDNPWPSRPAGPQTWPCASPGPLTAGRSAASTRKVLLTFPEVDHPAVPGHLQALPQQLRCRSQTTADRGGRFALHRRQPAGMLRVELLDVSHVLPQDARLGFPSGSAPGAHPSRTETRMSATLPSRIYAGYDAAYRIIVVAGDRSPRMESRSWPFHPCRDPETAPFESGAQPGEARAWSGRLPARCPYMPASPSGFWSCLPADTGLPRNSGSFAVAARVACRNALTASEAWSTGRINGEFNALRHDPEGRRPGGAGVALLGAGERKKRCPGHTGRKIR